MKLILFCLVGTAAATSAAAPVNEVSPSNEITATRDTHGWSQDHISLAADSNNDHTAHSAVFYPHQTDFSTHLADPRTHGGSGKNKLTLPTPKHAELGTTDQCDKIVCSHVARTYNTIATSSIVVEHKCGGTAGVNDTQWGARFSSSRDSATRKQVHSDPHAACEETKCTQGHVCGLVPSDDGTTAPACQCHRLTTAYDNPAAVSGTTTTYIPSDNTVYSTTAANTVGG